MKALADRKLFIQNLGHASVAYTGYFHHPHLIYIHEVLSLSDMREFVRNTMRQSAEILLVLYPEEFTREQLYGYIDDLMNNLNNEPPKVNIRSPLKGEMVDGAFVINGVATDDISVQTVLIRIDGGQWEEVNGTETWRIEIEPARLSEGSHVIEAISFDGSKYSDVDEIEIEYGNIEHQIFDEGRIMILVILVIGTLCTIYLVKRETRKKKRLV